MKFHGVLSLLCTGGRNRAGRRLRRHLQRRRSRQRGRRRRSTKLDPAATALMSAPRRGEPAPGVASTPYSARRSRFPQPFPRRGITTAAVKAWAYHDKVKGNAGGQYRTSEDVDIIVSFLITAGGG